MTSRHPPTPMCLSVLLIHCVRDSDVWQLRSRAQIDLHHWFVSASTQWQQCVRDHLRECEGREKIQHTHTHTSRVEAVLIIYTVVTYEMLERVIPLLSPRVLWAWASPSELYSTESNQTGLWSLSLLKVPQSTFVRRRNDRSLAGRKKRSIEIDERARERKRWRGPSVPHGEVLGSSGTHSWDNQRILWNVIRLFPCINCAGALKGCARYLAARQRKHGGMETHGSTSQSGEEASGTGRSGVGGRDTLHLLNHLLWMRRRATPTHISESERTMWPVLCGEAGDVARARRNLCFWFTERGGQAGQWTSTKTHRRTRVVVPAQ